MSKSPPGVKVKMVAENADLSALDPAYLTNNVYAIRYYDERAGKSVTDLIIGKRMGIFDAYYDLGYEVERIWHADGRRNPKTQECELRVRT